MTSLSSTGDGTILGVHQPRLEITTRANNVEYKRVYPERSSPTEIIQEIQGKDPLYMKISGGTEEKVPAHGLSDELRKAQQNAKCSLF